MTDQPKQLDTLVDPDDENQDMQTSYDALLNTNTLLSDDVPVENARAVLALLGYLNVTDECLGEDGGYGLYLVHEWLRRSLAYKGKTAELVIPDHAPPLNN